MGVTELLKKVDAFPKTLEEFRVRTSSGAAVSVCAMLCMFLLFVSEVGYYMKTDVTEYMDVDHTRGEKLRINFDITFPRMACSVVHLDAMDISGKHQLDVDHNVVKIRLDKNGKRFGTLENNELRQTITTQDELLKYTKDKDGDAPAPAAELAAGSNNADAAKVADTTDGSGSGEGSTDGSGSGGGSGSGKPYCGPCYGAGAPGACCNTCSEVRELYRQKGWAFRPSTMEQCQKEGFIQNLGAERGEGCTLRGYLEVPKVGGNFHFAPGKSFQQAHSHVHDLVQFTVNEFNISHRINSLSFGRTYPDMTNPLDGYNYTMGSTSGMYQYYMQVVPTDYNYLNGKTMSTNQFSVTDHMRKLDSRQGRGLPGVFFFYDVSPIRVRIVQSRRSFTSFLTSVCAIIGGVFTVMGLVDKAVYHFIQRAKQRGSSGGQGLQAF